MNMKGGEVVVFDFDGTLYKGDSFLDFSFFTLGKLKFFFCLIKSLPHILAWKLGSISNEKAKQRLFSTLFKGMKYEDFREKGELFKNNINKKENEDLLNKIREYKEKGKRLYIITASPEEWIRPWANDNGIDDVVGTKLEIINGVLTGNFASPNCWGKEKVNRLLEKEPAREDYILTSFGDSKGDEELFKFSDKFERVRN